MKEIKIPELAESITEGTIAEWLVKKGEKVEKGDPVVELETDKVNVEVNAEDAGVLTEIIAGEGDDVEVGDTIGKIDENAEAGSDSGESEEQPKEEKKDEGSVDKKEDSKESAPSEESKKEETKETTDSQSDDVIASPAARKRARELNIDLNEVAPRDPMGRVRPEDVEAAAKGETSKETKKQNKKDDEQQGKTEFDKPVERVKMSRRRQTIAKNLVSVQQDSAMLTTFNEVDMSAVMKLRSERKDKFLEKHDVKLGFMSFFTKAVVGALKEFPLLNAEIQGKELVLKKFYDIGIAVSTEEGLVVPVVRDADKKDFAGVEKSIADLGKKARDNKLGLDDLQGGTFSITNGGIFGSMLSTPILNAPQVGILGMHNIQKRAMVMPDDSIEVRPDRKSVV